MGQSKSARRTIESIYVISPTASLQNPSAAIAFIESFDESKQCVPFILARRDTQGVVRLRPTACEAAGRYRCSFAAW